LNNIVAFDETSDINQTSNYSLSIRLSADGFSFCILDEIRNKYIGIKHFPIAFDPKHYPEKISEIFENEEYLSRNYKKVRVLFQESRSTLIPLPLFDQQHIKELAGFNFDSIEDETVLFNKIHKINSYTLFPVSLKIKELIDKKFSNVQYFHQSQPLIENALHQGKGKSNSDRIHISVTGNNIDICLIKSARFELFNSYSFSAIQDILYYTLNLYEQFKISPDKSDLCLSGEIQKHDELWTGFSRYIRNISLEIPSDIQSRSYKFNELPVHAFTHFLNLPQCE